MKKEVRDMCDTKKSSCQHHEKLKDTPKECTPEQIKECHPDAEEHPCEEEES